MKSCIEEFVENDCVTKPHTLEDYEASQAPRWCKGCGDFGVLTALQRSLRDGNVDPENVVCVSGIGCSSRLPHYIRTYGFHGIHGRALPIASGVSMSRPDLRVITIMGDGDCFSIGGNHWLHATRYNPNMLVLVLDNQVYALTKKQASPTTPAGTSTNTTPKGSFLEPFNPISTMMGMPNVSFLAQTATWFPGHLEATIRRAFNHKGMAFVRVLQRCPAYMPDAFGEGGLRFPVTFLRDEKGIEVDAGDLRLGSGTDHDPRDFAGAQRIAATLDPAPMGLVYWNPDLPTYNEIRYAKLKPTTRQERIRRLDAELDKYSVENKQ